MHPMETETLNLAPRDAGDRFMDASMVTSLPVRGNGSLAGHTSPKLEAGSNLDAVLSFRFEVPDRSLLGAASGGNKSSTLSAVASGSCMRDSDHFASSCAQAGRKTAPGFDDDVSVDAIRTPRGIAEEEGICRSRPPPAPGVVPGLPPMNVTIPPLQPSFSPHHPRGTGLETTRRQSESTILNLYIDKHAKTDRI